MPERRPRLIRESPSAVPVETQVARVQKQAREQGETLVVVQTTVSGVQGDVSGVQADVGALQSTVSAINATISTLPGSGVETQWSFTGTGSAVTFSLPGRTISNPARFHVHVGGVLQAPSSFSIPASPSVIVFSEPPPAGVPITIYSPLYGS